MTLHCKSRRSLKRIRAWAFLRAVIVGAAAVLLGAPCVAATPSDVATRTTEEQRTIDVYKRANKAVVFITTRTYYIDPFDFFEEVKPREGSGTGTIVDAARGLVVTNLHVIESVLKGGGTVEIMLHSGHNSKARLLGFDRQSDLAVFQLQDPSRDITGLEYGDSAKLEVGQRVLAIGNPFGLYRSLTQGIISSLDRTMKTPGGVVLKDLVQTDAAINPGNSGGPLLDADGRLIGINTAILSQSGDSAGIGFAIPINAIKRIVPELIATGKVSRPQMGWQLVDTDQGPMILRVAPDSVAAEAGVQPIERVVEGVFTRGFRRDIDSGDLVYKVNGKRVQSRDEIEELISKSRPGAPVILVLRRGGAYGKERQVEVLPEMK